MTHKHEYDDGLPYLDLVDQQGAVDFNQNDFYSTHMFTQKAFDIIRHHNKIDVSYC